MGRQTKRPEADLAEHDLAWYLNDLSQPEDALAVLNRARPLYRQFPDRRTQFRLHWLEGRIAFRLGDYTEAEPIFAQLWDEFWARDLPLRARPPLY